MISFDPLAPWLLVVLGAVVLLAACWILGRTRPGRLLTGTRMLLVVVVALIWLQPGAGRAPAQAQTSKLQVLVVVDRTVSMSAEDYDGHQSRMTGVRDDLAALVRDLPDARFGLISFGSFARLELPFTSDTTAFTAAVTTLRREGAFAGTGSRMDRPLATMRQVLADAHRQHPDRVQLVVFVSDGENTASGTQASFASLKPLLHGGLVLGYGTVHGGRMLVDDPDQPGAVPGDYITDSSGSVLSHLHADNLRRIAGQLGARYAHRTSPGGMKALVSGLSAGVDDAGGRVPARYHLGWALALLALLLALPELAVQWRGLLGARRELRAVRRGGAR